MQADPATFSRALRAHPQHISGQYEEQRHRAHDDAHHPHGDGCVATVINAVVATPAGRNVVLVHSQRLDQGHQILLLLLRLRQRINESMTWPDGQWITKHTVRI